MSELKRYTIQTWPLAEELQGDLVEDLEGELIKYSDLDEWSTRTPQSEWVSVDDRLPTEEEEYLIWPHHKYAGVMAMFYPYSDHGGHRKNTFEIESDYGEVSQIDVTHWQPLPTAPK